MLKRTDLIVGNYYTFHGKKNTECWWLYDNQPNFSVYRVLTGDGTIGWLSLHDEVLEAFGITFKLYEEDDIIEERS